MSRYHVLILLVSALYATSCKDEFIIKNYKNGNIAEQYQYRGDSLKHGEYKSFTESGQLQEEATYVEGYLDGTRKIYNEKGNLEIEETYNDKMLNGPYKVYHDDGGVQLEAEYVNNVMSGLVKGYYPSGNIKEEVTFADNMEEGPFTEYHENGNVMWKGTYKGGDKEFGLLEKFDTDGKLIRKMMCDNEGRCTTTWTIEKEK